MGGGGNGSLEYPKTYDVMGQFSRYIHAGYYRFGATLANNSTLMVSSYKDPKTKKFSLVVINPGTVQTNCRLKLSGFTAANLSSFVTSDNSAGHWKRDPIQTPQTDGSFVVAVPPVSVVTFTGTAN